MLPSSVIHRNGVAIRTLAGEFTYYSTRSAADSLARRLRNALPMRVAVIINPICGPRRTRGAGAILRAHRADEVLRAAGADPEVFVTRHAGHASELARLATAHEWRIVYAWGGDGTVNEVASALAFTPVALAVVPGGSGNGLARSLGVPFDIDEALRRPLTVEPRTIDMGEAGGRRFANVAGLGFDAKVARTFNEVRSGRSGLWTYVRVGLREGRRYRPQPVEIRIGAERLSAEPLAVAFANSPQYGNGAVICPAARVDDGRLHLVVINGTTFWRDLWRTRRLFSGTADRDPGIVMRPFTELAVSCDEPILFHVDGDPVQGAGTLDVRVLPSALRICA